MRVNGRAIAALDNDRTQGGVAARRMEPRAFRLAGGLYRNVSAAVRSPSFGS
jgi:hypothetical protein